jgi:hypothetical protein
VRRQRHVRAAERLEERQEIFYRLVADVEALHPRVLVVADQRRLFVREDPPVAAAHHDLGVEQVRDAAVHGPLARLGWAGEVIARIVDHGAERGGGGSLDL